MKKEDKGLIIEQIKTTISSFAHLYLADIGGLNSAQTSDLRRQCNKKDIKLVVVKNTLLRKALEGLDKDYSALYEVLAGETSIMLSDNAKEPAVLIKEFGKANVKNGKPVLKAAFVEECAYIGADQLDTLVNIKSREELIGEIIGLLQSPAKNVISALQSGGSTIHGVLETLSKR
jgi:large subunit ribosomal protein L10